MIYIQINLIIKTILNAFQVKIVENADNHGKENKNRHCRVLPDIHPPQPGPYEQTLLPYQRSQSTSFVNVNALIRRPKVGFLQLN